MYLEGRRPADALRLRIYELYARHRGRVKKDGRRRRLQKSTRARQPDLGGPSGSSPDALAGAMSLALPSARDTAAAGTRAVLRAPQPTKDSST